MVGGYAALGKNARLFMVPGMYHCGGGPGPNVFNGVLGAIESWVEHGVAPSELIATKFTDDNPARPVQRTMPLCPFPHSPCWNRQRERRRKLVLQGERRAPAGGAELASAPACLPEGGGAVLDVIGPPGLPAPAATRFCSGGPCA